ncbi:GNAT family N-acetyltransferase [Paenibacillus mendelii]|uniref:GNAT family N-acetyltransferase n=1 Tax=Paenibacillus mendelii TaxID=206163 RepID=A0ABV6JG65_9BACL|nr:GNAT family N-acetyltransferase [Paenibacillus mendelii]MCQ6557670.1 GNAT family N-acetyltransferase [Paenibacillus mendelii]
MSTNSSIGRSSHEESSFVRNKLIEYNAKHVPDDLKSNYEEINLVIKSNDGVIIGGLNSVFCWNWIEVDILWVDETCRGMNYGSKLLHEIEEIARAKKCTFIKLNTFSFQAPAFYIKQGYQVIGTIENAPRGCTHYYYKKDIQGE